MLVGDCSEQELDALTDRLMKRLEESDKVRLAVGTSINLIGEDIRAAMRLADERMYRNKETYYRDHPEMKREV